MNARAYGKDNNRLFCWEQVDKSNRLFRISQIFAPRLCADKLLPLYALFSAIEQICSSISDEDVACRKLNWWRLECLREDRADSRHPVMKELNRTGALEDLRVDTLAQLLDGAESRINAAAPPDMEALKAICLGLQRPQFELEIDVSGLKEPMLQPEPGLLARNGMLQLIRESVHRKEQSAYWWIPLNSLARHAVRREDVAGDPQSRAAADLMTEILAQGESWGKESQIRNEGGAVDLSQARHWFAINGLYARKLKRLGGMTPNLFAGEIARLGPADLFKAWKSARRLLEY